MNWGSRGENITLSKPTCCTENICEWVSELRKLWLWDSLLWIKLHQVNCRGFLWSRHATEELTEAFSVNCLRSLPAVAGCFLELNDVCWVLRSTNVSFKQVFLQWKWVYCSLAVALERTVFPFVKQYIEYKMAVECCYDVTFRAHFLGRRKWSAS